MIDSLKEKYSMLDESVISMALEASNWDVDLATVIFEGQKEEFEKVRTTCFLSVDTGSIKKSNHSIVSLIRNRSRSLKRAYFTTLRL